MPLNIKLKIILYMALFKKKKKKKKFIYKRHKIIIKIYRK